MKAPLITIFHGGISREREVSLESGRALFSALKERFDVELLDLKEAALPSEMQPEETIVFPALHGTFGEDGDLQVLLEERQIIYAGSDSEASRLCMDKPRAKQQVEQVGVTVVPGFEFDATDSLDAEDVEEKLGQKFVVKPAAEGSSIGLYHGLDKAALEVLLPRLSDGRWMIEKQVCGREITVGVLDGQPLGLVEVLPKGGVYDFQHKYNSGLTEFRFPAEVTPLLKTKIKENAQKAFVACGCRDFCRVDFMVFDDECYFLEINTLPGLTDKSLFPKSASCYNLNFSELSNRLILPALRRFQQTHRYAPSSKEKI